ncbi:hypothetical protein N7445_001718 [Penicillium cf. griseofulvum]|nr:hypothetical protein N7445_001718 [Penicillium cf. griseofulvum]
MAQSNDYHQEPMAIIGFACRLPGGNNSPQKLWDFLEAGSVASRDVPESRFSFGTHFDGSNKPKTMRQAGGMFLGDIDLADFDAGFFEVGGTEAVAMDPNQRQMLEVVFEGLENAGIPLEKLDNAPVGCFVGSYSSDYSDMQARDPEDRPAGNALGIGRTIMANRLSYFLNIKGPSVTLDTACSGSLQGLDLAARYLNSRDIDAAIVATSNLYMSPEHVIDAGAVGSAHSPTALCHTFDVAADGYVKAEAVSTVIVKRLSDAIRDRDPIRAVVLGTASNSNGRTAGIASPNAESQAVAIRAAYAHAGITDFNATTYLECHGTGTQAGDPTEVRGAGSVFAATRDAEKPLIIGSIKSNVGHSEPAAGISGLMKAIMSMEKGWIPGNPTFITPSPKSNKVLVSRTGIPWPANAPLRASINSFGFGGSNAHAIIEAPKNTELHHASSYKTDEDEFSLDEDDAVRPSILVLSANDAVSLRAGITSLGNHLINPRVKVGLPDLSYTLSERRSKLWHRGFLTTRNTDLADKEAEWVVAKKAAQTPRIGFVFTGQGAQWPQMGKDLLQFFPWTRSILEELDQVLQALPKPPSWSLLAELTEKRSPEHLRQPEFSQPLVTALQICLVAVLGSWGITPSATVGHSSGEIVAAYSAGLLDRAGAITAAFYRGRAALNRKDEIEKDVGMLAVGLGPEAAQEFLGNYVGTAWIACFNSPSSVTISGKKATLQELAEEIKGAGHFARLLQVDLAYHSELMGVIGQEYEQLLSSYNETHPESTSTPAKSDVTMFSSVTQSAKTTPADALYWKTNMVSAVQFDGALKALLEDDNAPNFLIEIGPSGALAGPVSQILKARPTKGGVDVSYSAAWARGTDAGKQIFDVAGQLWASGAPIDLAVVNEYTGNECTLIDLPNYTWNHSVKYWHENAASKDWRFRKFPVHDLLGSKLLGSSWQTPIWRAHLNVANVPWVLDHEVGGDAIMPAAGYVTMAVEGLYQKYTALLQPGEEEGLKPNDFAYRVRNARFIRALVLEEGKTIQVTTTLTKVPGNKDWHEFHISSPQGDVQSDHCYGLIRIQDPVDEVIEGEDALPLKSPQNAKLWYKVQREVGMHFGPKFQKMLEIETISGQRKARTLLSLSPPEGKHEPQSYYPIHPAALDGFVQSPVPANSQGERIQTKYSMIPSIIDDFIINRVPSVLHQGRSIATSVYSGRGRPDQDKSWVANASVYDSETGTLVARITGLNYIKLDVPPKPDPHTFHGISWKPDITFLTQDQILHLTADKESTNLDTIVDLIAHKKPALKVLEVNLDNSDASSVWLDNGDSSARVAYSRYDFASASAKTLVSVEQKYEDKGAASFLAISQEKENLGLPTDVTYDLAIVKASEEITKLGVEDSINKLKPLFSEDTFILLISPKDPLKGSVESFEDVSGAPTPGSAESVSSPEDTVDIDIGGEQSSVSSAAWDEDAAKIYLESVKTTGLGSVLEIPTAGNSNSAYLSRNTGGLDTGSKGTLIVASLSQTTPEVLALQGTLEKIGWTVELQKYPFSKPSDGSIVLVLDELFEPVLTKISEAQWTGIKALVTSGAPLLWVTQGAQSPVTNPDNAMVHGFFRVARQEDGSVNLTTLDVESSVSDATSWAIDQVLGLIKSGKSTENEYAERNGLLQIQRIIPDAPLNDFRHAEDEGLEPVVKSLHGNEALVQLRAEQLGTFQSLTWCETEVIANGPPALDEGYIEVDVMAVGVNFKDVAITMGIVPDNEYMLGLECGGVVKRLGPGVDKFKVGDRVCMLKGGSYANRVRTHVDRCHIIPDSMTFEEAATLPSVYLCSLYSMYHMANLREGQSVLIHSATGGVGIACIQLAQYKKAEIYVTVGTEEKRQFLESTYGIPRSRMFSSRNTKFEQEILRETGGRGIDCIINSLVGELLDASWRIVADGGTMVEIGKRDIIDRNTLSMEPFDRNCSFRAVDLSFVRDMTEKVIARSATIPFHRRNQRVFINSLRRLFGELFVLINAGHLKAITPVTTFPFDNVIGALSHIRSGRHLGKIVISRGDNNDVQVPIRPAIRSLVLDPTVSYLIVGGLKGACGTLAIHLALHGAKHIIINSRSGISDEASARIIRSCNFQGCAVIEAKGDVADFEVVSELFRSARPQIAGIVQGAMVLRDKPYETMTLDDYHTAIRPKVQGTWNLHRASELHKTPLAFFTLLSSTSGIVGNKGQANYAAANTFLDAFAGYRHELGLPANTVDLGLIEDVGYAAEQGTELNARFDKRIWTPINEGTLRKILTYSILQQDRAAPLSASTTTETITGVGFPLPVEGTGVESDPRFSYLFNSRGDATGGVEASDGSDSVDQAIRAFRLMHKSGADVAALGKAGLEVISGQFVKTLRLETEPEPARPLIAYGLDSLSAVELRNWIRIKLGSELTTLDITNAGSLIALADKVVSKLPLLESK